MPLPALAGPLLGSVAKLVLGPKHRKAALGTALGKLMGAQETGTAPQLEPEELSALALGAQKDSWKDEFATLVVLGPIVLLLAGALVRWWSGDPEFLDAASAVIDVLRAADIDLDHIIIVTVGAAFCQKVTKR